MKDEQIKTELLTGKPKKQEQSPRQFGVHGGEMGERIRSFNWSQSSLGPISEWSQSLRTTVGLVLSQRFPMLLWWGPEYISIYNDAYIPVLGAKHPVALGQPVRECWSEIWQVLQPLIDTPFAGGPSTWMEDLQLLINRRGYWEETHFTIGYSPVPDETMPKGIGGVLATVHEITEKILHERSLITLRELSTITHQEQSLDIIYHNVAEALGKNNKDFPFAAIYKINEGGDASLAASSGLDEKQTVFPGNIDTSTQNNRFSAFCQAYESNKLIISEIDSDSGDLPAGPWEIVTTKMAYIPIGFAGKDHPYAIISVALNPYRQLNDEYLHFLQLIGERVSLEINKMLALKEETKKAAMLAEIDKAKTVFFSNISHEFRTPLTLMLGSLEELINKKTEDFSEENRTTMEAAHRNALRLLRLVNNLLDFNRIEAGKTNVQYRLTDLCKYTMDLASTFRSVIEKASLVYEVHCDAIKAPVYVDKEMWEKIVLNLISNAFKYTLEGSITVTLTANEGWVYLKVKDTGVGIAEHELPKMFERFHRIENTKGRTYEGTGIGLSLINELVNIHNGNISINSKLGEGSEFTIALPTGKDHLPPDQIIEEEANPGSDLSDSFVEEAKSFLEKCSPERSGVANEKATQLVLVVDDNADMREYFQKLLQSEYIVLTASNGLEALRVIQKESPDLIVSDVMMPVMDGFQLVKEVKSNPLTADIPFIIVSARAGDEAKIEGYTTGADDYLVKPFSARELLARVASQLQTKKIRTEAQTQLQDIFKVSPVAIGVVKGADYRYVLVNPAFQKLLNRKEDELLGKAIKEVFPEMAADGVLQVFDQVYQSGEPVALNEIPAILEQQANGAPVWRYLNYSVEAIKNVTGETHSLVVVVVDVTEQVNARKKIELSEHALRYSEERLRLATASASIMWWEINPATGETFVSDNIGDVFEVFNNPEQVDMMTAIDRFTHPQDVDAVKTAFANALQGTGSLNIDYRIVNSKNEILWVNSYGTLIRNEQKRLVGISQNITERKKAEEKLKESEQRFRGMASQAPIFVWETDKELQVAFLNKAGLNYFNIDDSVVSPDLSRTNYMHPSDRDMVNTNMHTSAESQEPYSMEIRLRNGHTGLYRWFLDKGVPQYTDDFFTGFIGTSMDIDDSKRNENALQEKVTERTRELAEMNAAFENAEVIGRMGNYIWNLANNEMIWSKNMYDIFGVSSDSFVPSFEKISDLVLPEDAAIFRDGMAATLEKRGAMSMEYRIMLADTVKFVIGSSRFGMNDKNQPVIYGIVQDISEIKKKEGVILSVQHDLRQKNELLEKLNKELESFAYISSHDMQEPLRKIQTFISRIVETEPQLSIKGQDYFARIKNSASRMQILIEDLLSFTRVKNINKIFESVDLNELVESVKSDMKERILEKKATIEVAAPDKIRVVPYQFQQILTNLLSNALKFAQPGLAPHILVTSEIVHGSKLQVKGSLLNTDYCHIVFEDNGIGFEQAYSEKIFEVFQRLHDRGSFPGTGVGLAIVKKIVDNHNGIITASSDLGKGARFDIYIPQWD